MFWASGGHIVNDLPPILGDFRRSFPQVPVALLPVLSELPGAADFIAGALHKLAGKAQ